MSTAVRSELSLLESICGGWSKFEPLTQEDVEIFQFATRGLLGVHYEPSSVSRQVVAGVNYRFRCTVIPVVLNPEEYDAIVQIYKPLEGEGEPFITSIKPVLL